MTIRNFTAADVTDQSGRVFLVTGANAGLGFETAKALAGKGARVLLGCRSDTKAKAAMDAIRAEHDKADMRFIPLDLGGLDSIRAAAELVKEEQRLDVLVNNAGIMGPPYEQTADGFESQFGVNHLGSFALSGLLLDKVSQGENPRIVITSSMAHKGGKIDFDDIDAKKSYSRWTRYAQSKLANLLHMYELDRRLRAAGSPVTAIACHPGVADTELSRHMPDIMVTLMRPLASLIMNTAAQGAWPTLAAAAAPGVEGGQYFGPARNFEWTGPACEVTAMPKARNAELARRLWELSEEMTGVQYGF